jgi:hypothetical protein
MRINMAGSHMGSWHQLTVGDVNEHQDDRATTRHLEDDVPLGPFSDAGFEGKRERRRDDQRNDCKGEQLQT